MILSLKTEEVVLTLEFDTDIELDDAANDIRERVARVVDNLPSEADAPQILKQAAGFTTTMWLVCFIINLVRFRTW